MRDIKKVTVYENEEKPRVIKKEIISNYQTGDSCSTVYRGQDVIWYAIGIVEFLLLLRLTFQVFGARLVPFTDLIYAFSYPFVAPFQGIFGRVSTGAGILDSSIIVAMIVFLFIGWGIAELISLLLSPQGRRC